ncbi:MAG: hypothetical protein LBI63_00845, partial [Candidatus Ancillula sp.]|nr:hypothetical protein [Candidatus Ancillula sp.]
MVGYVVQGLLSMKEKRKISKYSIRRNFDGTEVVFNTKTGKVLSFDSTDKIDDAINQNSDLFQLLAEYKFIVHDDEYNQILEGYKKIQNETLFLIILAH